MITRLILKQIQLHRLQSTNTTTFKQDNMNVYMEDYINIKSRNQTLKGVTFEIS